MRKETQKEKKKKKKIDVDVFDSGPELYTVEQNRIEYH